MNVIKRDGRTAPFNGQKIADAVLKAFQEVDHDIDDRARATAGYIAGHIQTMNQDMTVEQIQDIVEQMLMDSDRKDVARAYIIYRNDRNRTRMRNSRLMREVRAKLDATDVENQNANVDERSFGGRFGAVAEQVLRSYALDELMSDMARNNHVNNEIYIHDLSHYPLGDHNCMSIPFDDLLANGFTTRQTDVRPAQSVSTAFQLMAVIFQLQSLQQYGGVSATHTDHTMVPYVRKSFYKHWKDGFVYVLGLSEDQIDESISSTMPIDSAEYKAVKSVYQYAIDMTEREVYQAVEGMYHNLNTLQSRSGNQLPFTSINYGTCTLPEGRMVTKALLDVSIKGIGKLHRTPIFPKNMGH